MEKINRKIFFDSVRNSPFDGSFTPEQVEGLTKILDYFEEKKYNVTIEQLAYIFATVFHETAATMQPIEEHDNKAKTYLKSKKYYPWYGRGLVQITWKENYAKYGISDPKKALEWPTALFVLFDGMVKGRFSAGNTLSKYFNENGNDPVGARRIINGVDKKDLIAKYWAKFNDALKTSLEEVKAPEKPVEPVVEVKVPEVPPITESLLVRFLRALRSMLK